MVWEHKQIPKVLQIAPRVLQIVVKVIQPALKILQMTFKALQKIRLTQITPMLSMPVQALANC